MFVWGRNNNHLFRQNHKKTYSLPQKIPINATVTKCAPGYDYIILLTNTPGTLLCYYQSAFYKITNFANIVDVATTDNMIVIVDSDGVAWIMEFNSEKIISGEINPAKVNLKQQVTAVYMNYSDIFLTTTQEAIYHLRRNEWYETKTYSDPVKVEGMGRNKVQSIAPGGNFNYFLLKDGRIYRSEKTSPTQAALASCKVKFKAIAASDYLVAIAQNGRLYIWGEYNQHPYQEPTQFGKLAQRFRSVQVSGENGFAITVNGEGWIWGKNASGQLGISDYEPRVHPFPLITMEKETIRDIYLGQGYTVCTVASSEPKKIEVNFKKHTFNIHANFEQIKKKNNSNRSKSKERLYFKDIQRKNEEEDQLIGQFSSLKVRKVEKHRKHNDQKNKSMQTQVLRRSYLKKNKGTDKTPRKSNERMSHRSISPLSNKSRSNSRSPLSKSIKTPYLDHQRFHSHVNIPKKQQTPTNNRSPHARINTVVDSKHLVRDAASKGETRKSNTSADKALLSKVRKLEQQNCKLSQIIAIKDNIIQDITQKIGLLQEAIEEHERTLTARDNTMDQYQRREKEYLIHIDELEKHIDSLIKGKNQEIDYTKEKDHFLAKIAEYESTLQQERCQYRQKIKNLEEEINTFRSMDKENCLSSSRMYNSKAQSIKNQERLAHSKPLEEKDLKLNFIISRIEDSKVRIAKSATKLYEMMDDN